jgi:hypothetical protein
MMVIPTQAHIIKLIHTCINKKLKKELRPTGDRRRKDYIKHSFPVTGFFHSLSEKPSPLAETATRKYCCCYRSKYGEFQSVSVTEANILKKKKKKRTEGISDHVDHKVEFRKRRFCVKVAQLLPGKYFI